jgi:copper oxidase (laccase) domain-containing protein
MNETPGYILSPVITTPHAFFTRRGGVSPAPFASLNFGGSEDDPENIRINRERALRALRMNPNNVARLNQVHGGDVIIAIGAADCYPLLFHDPVNNVIGAAHCGWKGTLARIAGNTVDKMTALGAEAKHVRVAIGPGICRDKYEVSEEVIRKFMDAGFPSGIHTGRQLDLLEANRFVLHEAGISNENVWALNRCTSEDDFFSYRRDSGRTGRMWAVIVL